MHTDCRKYVNIHLKACADVARKLFLLVFWGIQVSSLVTETDAEEKSLLQCRHFIPVLNEWAD